MDLELLSPSGLLFPKFRFGWKMSVHAIPQKLSSEPSLQTFMVVADKENSSVVLQVTSSFDHSSLDCNKNQVEYLSSLSPVMDNLTKYLIRMMHGANVHRVHAGCVFVILILFLNVISTVSY